jgi:predicted amino acid racemase
MLNKHTWCNMLNFQAFPTDHWSSISEVLDAFKLLDLGIFLMCFNAYVSDNVHDLINIHAKYKQDCSMHVKFISQTNPNALTHIEQPMYQLI